MDTQRQSDERLKHLEQMRSDLERVKKEDPLKYLAFLRAYIQVIESAKSVTDEMVTEYQKLLATK